MQQSASAAAAAAMAAPGEGASGPAGDGDSHEAASTAPAAAAGLPAELSLAPQPALEAMAAAAPTEAAAAAAASTAARGVTEGSEAAAVLGSGPVTLDTFRKLLGLLTNQREEIDALLPHCDIGSVRVDAVQLRAALLPWPERRMGEMREMLPRLAGGAPTGSGALTRATVMTMMTGGLVATAVMTSSQWSTAKRLTLACARLHFRLSTPHLTLLIGSRRTALQ